MDYRREGICEDVENRTIRPTLDQTCQVVEDGDVDRPTAAPSHDKHASESSTTRGRVTVGFSSLARESWSSWSGGIAAVPGIADPAMTTNSVLLSHLAKPLADGGFQRINVRLDSLDAAKFGKIMRWGEPRRRAGGPLPDQAQRRRRRPRPAGPRVRLGGPVHPPRSSVRRPVSRSACLTQLRLVRDPEILGATWPIDLPDSRTSRTASSQNSHGYAGRTLPIVDSLPRACAPNDRMSTKAGQLQDTRSGSGGE
jgi:hypothetical protein